MRQELIKGGDKVGTGLICSSALLLGSHHLCKTPQVSLYLPYSMLVMHEEGSETKCCCRFPTSPFCWILQHFVQCTVRPPSPPSTGTVPSAWAGSHSPVCCPCRAAQEPVTLRSAAPESRCRVLDVCAPSMRWCRARPACDRSCDTSQGCSTLSRAQP